MAKYKHIFAVAAYGESPFLPAQLESLSKQGAGSPVIICTSTKNAYIDNLGHKYGFEVYARSGKSSLRDDWNYAYEMASKQAELVTIAHQDDIYAPGYAKAVRHAYNVYPDMSVFCCRYDTIDAEGKQIEGKAEGVKRLLRFRLKSHRHADRESVKMSALRWGNAIGCPTCTYNVSLCGTPLFQNDYHFVIDWETLIRLAHAPGRFICLEKPLMSYRVHSGAETMKNIENHNREKEEREVFGQLHSKLLTSILMHFYRRSYKAYDDVK